MYRIHGTCAPLWPKFPNKMTNHLKQCLQPCPPHSRYRPTKLRGIGGRQKRAQVKVEWKCVKLKLFFCLESSNVPEILWYLAVFQTAIQASRKKRNEMSLSEKAIYLQYISPTLYSDHAVTQPTLVNYERCIIILLSFRRSFAISINYYSDHV